MLARWLGRDKIREAWELRERAVAEEAELIEGALRGTLDIALRHVITARQLAESLETGNVDALPRHMRELLEPMFPWYPWDNPAEALGDPDGIGEPSALSRLVYRAGRALWDSGRLEDPFAAYIWGRSA